MTTSEQAEFPWCTQLQSLYTSRTLTGASGKAFDNLASLSTRNNIHYLRGVMLDHRPGRTLEVGLAFGGSALAIAATHRELGNGARPAHTAIDLAQTSYWDNVATEQLLLAGLKDYVRIIEDISSTVLARLMHEGERFDFVYVDGSHQFEDVFLDFYFAGRMLTPGGLILFDDSSDRHVAKVLRFIGRNCCETFEPYPLDRYLTKSRDRLRRRLGEFVGRTQLRAFRKTKDGNASLAFIDF